MKDLTWYKSLTNVLRLGLVKTELGLYLLEVSVFFCGKLSQLFTYSPSAIVKTLRQPLIELVLIKASRTLASISRAEAGRTLPWRLFKCLSLQN
jgi:hypothetical protein